MAELSPDRYINLLPLLDTAQVVRVVPARRSVSKSRKSMRTKPCARCAARAI